MEQVYPVFISAVSGEFGQARDAVANALRARGLRVEVQSSFAQGAGTTLAKLHDYIRGCTRVLAMIGTRSGAYPPEGAVTDTFRAMLPPGMTRASYTQWEVLFARHHRVETFLFNADGYTPEQVPAAGDDAGAQESWRHWLFRDLGLDRQNFASADRLEALVMRHHWPDRRRAKPSNLPGSVGTLFKGRDEFLATLRASFATKSAAAIVGKAVHGLGGIGKTRAAIEYGHAYAEDYSALFFLIGKTENDLRDSLAALCGAAVLDLQEKDAPDLPARVASVINWLRTNPGWFLIIDNVDDEPAALATQALLDQLGTGDGHVLITSRVSAWGPMVQPLELELLTVDAAKELLRAGAPNRKILPGEDESLAQLADVQLGCLSLALVQAAAYIEDRRISFAEYRKRFDEQAAQLLAKLGDAAIRKLDYPKPVALTWLTSFARLGEPGRLLLDMLAWLSIEPIPRSLFDVWPQKDEFDLEEGLAELARFSLVHWESGNDAITVHRLVQRVTRDNQDEEARDIALGALFPWLYAVNPTMLASDVRCWPVLLPLLPHVLTLLDRAQEAKPYWRRASIYDEYATLLHSLARFAEAELLFRKALAIDEANLGADHTDIAVRLNNLTLVLIDVGKYDEAELLLRRSLAMGEIELEPDHPNLSIRLNNLGGTLQESGKFEEAESLYRRSLAIDEKYYGENHEEVSKDLNNLSLLMHATDRLNEAESLIRRSILISENTYGENHPDTALRLANLGMILRDKGEFEESKSLFRRSSLIYLTVSRKTGQMLPGLRSALQSYMIGLANSGVSENERNDLVRAVMVEADFNPDELWPIIFGDSQG